MLLLRCRRRFVAGGVDGVFLFCRPLLAAVEKALDIGSIAGAGGAGIMIISNVIDITTIHDRCGAPIAIRYGGRRRRRDDEVVEVLVPALHSRHRWGHESFCLRSLIFLGCNVKNSEELLCGL